MHYYNLLVAKYAKKNLEKNVTNVFLYLFGLTGE